MFFGNFSKSRTFSQLLCNLLARSVDCPIHFMVRRLCSILFCSDVSHNFLNVLITSNLKFRLFNVSRKASNQGFVTIKPLAKNNKNIGQHFYKQTDKKKPVSTEICLPNPGYEVRCAWFDVRRSILSARVQKGLKIISNFSFINCFL